jgi:rod shape-determining protein MreB
MTHAPRILDRLRAGIAIDIGTVWTRMRSPSTGELAEPTLHAVNDITGEVLAWGRAAVAQLTRSGSAVTLERPVQAGVVADFAAFHFILGELLGRAGHRRGLLRPVVAVSTAPVMTTVELAALRDACRRAAGADVRFVLATRAAAIGSDMAIDVGTGRMVVQAGAGATCATVFSSGYEVITRCARFGAQSIDSAVEEYLRREHQIWVGAESIRVAKERYATIRASGSEESFTLRGMDLATNLPRSVAVPRSVLREAALPVVQRLLDLVGETLAGTPPELAGDLLENGIVLTGGLARLDGLAEAVAAFTGCPVRVAEAPELATLRGLSRLTDAVATGSLVPAQAGHL